MELSGNEASKQKKNTTNLYLQPIFPKAPMNYHNHSQRQRQAFDVKIKQHKEAYDEKHKKNPRKSKMRINDHIGLLDNDNKHKTKKDKKNTLEKKEIVYVKKEDKEKEKVKEVIEVKKDEKSD